MRMSKKYRSNECHSEATGRGICFLSSWKSRYLLLLALMAPCLAAPAAAQELGRLFFTPQQRQDLDRRRATNRAEEEAPQIREGPLTVEGHVQRSSGKTTTWINGVPQDDTPASRDPSQVMVVPNQGEASVNLKIGQIYERTTGEIRDKLNGGSITAGKSSRKLPPDTRRGAAVKSPPAR